MPQVQPATAPTARSIKPLISTLKPFYIKINIDNMFPDIALVEFKSSDVFDSYANPNLDLNQMKADFIKLPNNNIEKIILVLPKSFLDHVEDATKCPSRAADDLIFLRSASASLRYFSACLISLRCREEIALLLKRSTSRHALIISSLFSEYATSCFRIFSKFL